MVARLELGMCSRMVCWFNKVLRFKGGPYNGVVAFGKLTCSVSQPHFGQVWGWSPTLGKVGDLESFGTPECLELDSKDQNTSHWGVLSVIGKVLKRRYRKRPRIGHLDICSLNHGQKKGRESNWQFDSRPLKVGNRPLPDIRFERATWRWKARQGLQLWFRPRCDRTL
jgi:hypothetical protein